MRTFLILVFCLCFFISCQTSTVPGDGGVVATNAWTAAYALAAGASDVRILTPYEMIHPSEYELRPSDITQLSDAKVIIYAGYEVMIQQIRTSLDVSEQNMLQIHTSYNLDEIEASVMKIANRLGTEELAKTNLDEIRMQMEEAKVLVSEHGLNEDISVVHFFQQSFASEAGIKIEAIFGPAPPEPRQIAEVARTNASLIIDNAHNPTAGALTAVLPEATYLVLLNFPGLHGTRTIQDVIEYNIRQLVE